jgi:valyl-tRNA synthetase
MPRSLRISNDSPKQPIVPVIGNHPSERAIRIDEGEKMREKVDRIYALQESLKSKKDAFKKETEGMEAVLKELISDVRNYAEEHDLVLMSGVDAVVEFTPSTSRSIDPQKLLAFLKRLGKIADFWNLVKVTLKDATQHYGEAVLESEGAMKIEVESRGNMKIRKLTN